MKQLSILGSTGSIGVQTLDVVRRFPNAFSIAALAAHGNRPELMAEQIAAFHPALVVVYDEQQLDTVRNLSRSLWNGPEETFPEFAYGMEGLILAATLPEVDLVVTSLVGMIGIQPTIAAIQAGKDIGLANKETLVCAGSLIMELARRHQVRILPIDSEHGAVLQCLTGIRREDVSRIWLTASGGPFRGYTREQLMDVTLEQALKHPNWAMGAKITIDSATLMNKGLEMMECKWLWDVPIENVIPVVHPQSLIHSMVETVDGSVLAQIAPVDMRLPIEVALFYPERGGRVLEPLDFRTLGSLTFEPIDEEAFPSIRLAREAILAGGLMPTCFNAANEIAVDKFRRREISFVEIFELVEGCMRRLKEEGEFPFCLEGALTMKQRLETWL